MIAALEFIRVTAEVVLLAVAVGIFGFLAAAIGREFR